MEIMSGGYSLRSSPVKLGYSIIPCAPRSSIFMVTLSQNPFDRDDRVTSQKKRGKKQHIFMLTVKLWRILQSQIDF